MNEWVLKLLTGLLMGLGAMARSIWSYINLYQAHKEAGEKLKFDWLKFATSVLPSLVAGFAAGYVMEVSAPDFVLLFFSGAGLSSLQSKV